MGVPTIRAVTTSLAIVAAATLTSTVTAAPAQSAASTPPVAVSISAKRAVTMPTTVQPGVNTFKVTTANKDGSGFQLVQTAAGYSAADAARDIEKGLDGGNVKAIKRFEAHVTLFGGMAVTKDKVGKLIVDLEAGDYWALDINTNDPDKFFAFTVAGADTGNVMPEADSKLKAVQDTTWAHNPESIPNKGMMRFKNAASQNHFIVMAKLKKGMTYKDFKTWLAAAIEGPAGPSPVKFLMDSGVVSPGYSATFTYNLPKGNYVMLCFWPDAKMGGMPHVAMGMHRPITLK